MKKIISFFINFNENNQLTNKNVVKVLKGNKNN